MNGPGPVESPIAVVLDRLVLLLMLLVLAAILTTAMVMQYVFGELPCPLCLLQRVAMFGVCFGIIQQFRYGTSERSTGISLIFTIVLLVISVRQTLLDLFPRPGHEYIGTAIFGIHMPVWSVIIAVALLLGFTIKLAVLGSPRGAPGMERGAILRLGNAMGVYVVALCAINFISVVVQCGLGECHTFGYKLLQ